MKQISDKDLAAIQRSGLFDETWYAVEYPDVKLLGMDPIEHYLWVGARIGRNPSKEFNSSHYLLANPDVVAAGINPLLHYIRWGLQEGRTIRANRERQKFLHREGEAPSRPVIVYDSHNLKLQGAPNSLFEIAAGVKRRQRYSPILMTNALGPLASAYEEQRIECIAHGVSPNRLIEIEQREKYIQLLANHYKNAKASVVHANTLQNFHCILAAHVAGIPAIWNIRESENPDTYYDYLPEDLRNLAYSAFEKAAAIIFVADATRRRWMKRLDGLVDNRTISNGLDISRLKSLVYNTNKASVRGGLGVRPNDLMLLNVGTVTPRKGQHDLIDAIERLDEAKISRIVLAMVGLNDSEYSKDVERRLSYLSKTKGLRYIAVEESVTESERTKVAELYLAADTFVLTSRVESYPRVTLEAMEFGLSIISTPCFGVCEQLVDGESVLFYQEEDSKSLAMLIAEFFDSPETRVEFAQAARARLGALNSYDQMLEAYEAVYARAMNAYGNSALRKTA